jgi:hypothetical protein
MAQSAGDSSRVVLRSSCAWICSGPKMKRFVLLSKLYKRMSIVVNGVLLPSIALNCLPGCCTRMFSCSGILD